MSEYGRRNPFSFWRYAVETEFKDANGQPFIYAEDGKRAWGDELKSLQFDSSPGCVAINDDRTLVAVSVDHDIHLCNGDFKPTSTLRGHTSNVDAIAFQPCQPDILISAVKHDLENHPPKEPTILCWNLKDVASHGRIIDNDVIKSISKDAAETVRDKFAMLNPPFDLSSTVQETLSKTLEIPIAHSIALSNAEQCRSIHGRLASEFQSNIFSPSGEYLIYMPGNRPNSNGDDRWDVKIHSVQEHKDVLTLSGHRDAIMWIGYDGSEKLVGTAAWDGTFRIWNANTGLEKYKFETNSQNWTAGFSPDSKRFAGTCGGGILYVYSLDDGSKVFQLDCSKRLCRALDWAPDSKMLAVGTEFQGKVLLIDVEKREVVQERVLSMARVNVGVDVSAGYLDRMLAVTQVKFVDKGRKLVFWTHGDFSAEVHDLVAAKKWRFAWEGSRSYEDDNVDSAESTATTESRSGMSLGMEVWVTKDLIMVATIDHDAVRIWSVKMNSTDDMSTGA